MNGIMKQLICVVLAGDLVCCAAFADASNPPMTKIVFRRISPEIATESFAAKPKTLFIAGETHTRIEEEPDPSRGIHGLGITAERDTWMINLFNRHGQHMVDSGPTFVVHFNILPRKAPEVFAGLEYGKEVQFFRAHRAVSLGVQEIEGQRCDVSEFKEGDYRLLLYASAVTRKPFRMDIYRAGKFDFAVRYLSYETDLPFDARLFKPPEGVAISEVQPTKP